MSRIVAAGSVSARDTLAICAQRGHTVSAVVVDLDGVRGAPGGQLDDDCARAAIAKIQNRVK